MYDLFFINFNFNLILVISVSRSSERIWNNLSAQPRKLTKENYQFLNNDSDIETQVVLNTSLEGIKITNYKSKYSKFGTRNNGLVSRNSDIINSQVRKIYIIPNRIKT